MTTAIYSGRGKRIFDEFEALLHFDGFHHSEEQLVSYVNQKQSLILIQKNRSIPAQNIGKTCISRLCRLIELRLKILFYSPDLVRIKLSGLSLIKTKLIHLFSL